MNRPALISAIVSAIVCFIVVAGLVVLASEPAYARTTKGIVGLTDSSSLSVTILVLDMSGSMAENDPAGLRCSAANAFIDLSGPGNYIGVIGLDNNNGQRGGPHNFQLAQIWAQPTEMATLAERQALQHVIAVRSNNCQPDSDTPTYDALSQALQMLTTATNNGQIPGSVVLLTDGTPDPDTLPQMGAIQSDLIPRFKEYGWPIDTVALGSDGPVPGTQTTFHGFLSGLSNATGGQFYDDGNGVVPGISPLNIANFFVDIFARHNHRVLHKDSQPTALNGGTHRSNFSVTDYTNSLDVVVVKDQAATTASLVTPSGQVIAQSGSGVFVSQADPHYEIFSIDQPQPGEWELDVTGSGQFLMDSLATSGIELAPLNISQQNLVLSANSALVLGQPLTVSTSLLNNGQAITDSHFTLTGTIAYSGAAKSGQQSTQSFTLDDQHSPGTYMGTITIPATAPAGSYQIEVDASTVSLEAVVASQSRTVRIELFPVPVLAGALQERVIQWDPVLRTLYTPSFWPIPHLAIWALGSTSAQSMRIAGQVMWQQQPYPDATVTAVVHNKASHAVIPIKVVNTGRGHFYVQFAPPDAGQYILTFKTSGSFADSHGDLGTMQQVVSVVTVPATLAQKIHAWVYTVLYIFALVLFILLIRFFLSPAPQGTWERLEGSERDKHVKFAAARRNPVQAFLSRNLLHSDQVQLPPGLLIKFGYGNTIKVMPEGRRGQNWLDGSRRKLSSDFRTSKDLYCRNDEGEQHYRILPKNQRGGKERVTLLAVLSRSGKAKKRTARAGSNQRRPTSNRNQASNAKSRTRR